MFVTVCKRLGEAFLACCLLFAAGIALLCLDWIIEDDFFLGGAVPSEYFISADAGYLVPALLLMGLFAFITWRILTGRAWCCWRFIAALYLAGMAAWHGYFGISALFRFPGWFALAGKACYIFVMLFPAVWLFLPRKRYIPQPELFKPEHVDALQIRCL